LPKLNEVIQTARSVKTPAVNRRNIKPVFTQSEALSTINRIYKAHKAKLDKKKFVLKQKQLELAKLESSSSPQDTEMPQITQEEMSYLSTDDMEIQKDPEVRRLLKKYAFQKEKLFKEEMLMDTCKHMLNRDEEILIKK
jgi:hypothetical protein